MYRVFIESFSAVFRISVDVRAIFAPEMAVLPTKLIFSVGTSGIKPVITALFGLMYLPKAPAM
jgi:hypothetical protein